MVAFVIFWASAFSIIFFVLGVIFKGLASAFKSLLSSIGAALAVASVAALIGITSFILYLLIEGIAQDGFLITLFFIGLAFLDYHVIKAIIGGKVARLLQGVINILELVLSMLSVAFEGAAMVCERVYVKSLATIVKSLHKC